MYQTAYCNGVDQSQPALHPVPNALYLVIFPKNNEYGTFDACFLGICPEKIQEKLLRWS